MNLLKRLLTVAGRTKHARGGQSVLSAGTLPPLSETEQRLLDRLIDSEATFEEGLALYNSVTADGRPFPVAWEVHILELGIDKFPNRQDMRERLSLIRNKEVPHVGGVAQPFVHTSAAINVTDEIVSEAKGRLEAITASTFIGLPSHGDRWGAFSTRTRQAIATLSTTTEVLHYAQTHINFEHRGNVSHEGKFTALYERELVASFPRFAADLQGFADIADSVPDSVYLHNGRPISNVLFYLARVVMSCLSALPDYPKIVLEVGGGYGAPARLWMNNPIAKPDLYLILDIPESLFFADVFLRKEFGSDRVHYVRSADPLPKEALSRTGAFVLCPVGYHAALLNVPVDLIINTGSLQEMSEGWVDFYCEWLDRQTCSWFYSLNYFAQPIDGLWESGNVMSPRLSRKWTARLLRWNPAFVRMQTDRDYLEALYERSPTSVTASQAEHLIELLAARRPTGEVFAELIDLIRCFPQSSHMMRVLSYAMRMTPWPKEALWLADELLNGNVSGHERLQVEQWRQQLCLKRATGVEAYY